MWCTFEFWRIHFVTPILNPRTIDPIVCDVPRGFDDSDFDGSVRWGAIRWFLTIHFVQFPRIHSHHFAILHRSKQTRPILTTYRDEIPPCLRIIVSFQANEMTMINIRIISKHPGPFTSNALYCIA
jgi:hypothetical protein